MTAPRPATPPLLKRLNEEAVLETIRAGKPNRVPAGRGGAFLAVYRGEVRGSDLKIDYG